MPPMNPPDERFYCDVAVPYDPAAIIPTNTSAMRIITAALDNQNPLLRSQSKTGTRSARTGRSGRRGATFNVQAPMNGSGSAGVAPDMDALLTATFGAAPTIVAVTSTTYDLDDVSPALTLSSYRDPVSDETWDRILHGGVVESVTLESSEDLAQITFSGIGTYTADRPNFDSLDPTAQGGLVSFPTEPTTPVYNGQEVVGFRGSTAIDGNSFPLQNFQVTAAMNRSKRLAYGDDYPGDPTQGVREIQVVVGLFEENEAALNAFRHRSYSKVPFDMSFTMGVEAGNIWTWNFKSVQLADQTIDESGPEYIVRFDGMMAHESATGAKDEIQLVIT